MSGERDEESPDEHEDEHEGRQTDEENGVQDDGDDAPFVTRRDGVVVPKDNVW
jgi:hypothetical protein